MCVWGIFKILKSKAVLRPCQKLKIIPLFCDNSEKHCSHRIEGIPVSCHRIQHTQNHTQIISHLIRSQFWNISHVAILIFDHRFLHSFIPDLLFLHYFQAYFLFSSLAIHHDIFPYIPGICLFFKVLIWFLIYFLLGYTLCIWKKLKCSERIYNKKEQMILS